MPTARSTILIIEDDTAIRRGLVDMVSFAGYQAVECSNGNQAVDTAIETSPDLVLLDVLLPGKDGFDILHDLRQLDRALPVIMVTARGSENDRVQGLRDGADDYIVKPFSPKELIARVEAVLRRSPGRVATAISLRCGNRSIDFDRREVCVADEQVEQLSEREAGILHYLATHSDRAVDRDELLQHVWGLNPRGLQTRTVDMHIVRLREKLGDNASDAPIIVTVRSKGYMLSGDCQIVQGETA